MFRNRKNLVFYATIAVMLIITLLLVGCAPSNDRWDRGINPSAPEAGFWAGLWHGFILILSFIMSLFTREIGIYEVNNKGWQYNLGFVLGVCISAGILTRSGKKRKKMNMAELEDIGGRIEEKVRTGLKEWLDESLREGKKKEKMEEWEEIAKKIVEKIKNALKSWGKSE